MADDSAVPDKIVQVDGIGNVQFPGTMSDNDISAAIKAQLAAKSPAAPEQTPAQYAASQHGAGDMSSSGSDDGFGSYVKQGLKTLQSGAVGAGKGVIGTLYHVGKMVGAVPENKDFEAALQPGNAAEKVGNIAEQGAEYLAPGAIAGKIPVVAGAVDAIRGAKYLPAAIDALPDAAAGAVKVGARIAGKAAVNAGEAALVAKAQGSDVKSAAIGGAAIAPIEEAVPALVSKLKESATRTYGKVLNATGSIMKDKAAKVIPGLLEQGVTGGAVGTQSGLAARFARKADNFGEQIGNLWDAIPQGTTVKSQPIIDAIESAKSDLMSPGAVKTTTKTLQPGNAGWSPAGGNTVTTKAATPMAIEPAAVDNLNKIQNLVTNATDDAGNADVKDLRRFKQIWDETVAGKGGYNGKQLSLADQAGISARREGANAIRDVINSETPNVADLNRKYKFWRDAEDVMTSTLRRTSTQSTPLSETIATGAGAAGGLATGAGGAHAILPAIVMKSVAKLFNSGLTRSMGAVAVNGLANAIASGSSAATMKVINGIYAGQKAASSPTPMGTKKSASIPDRRQSTPG
jgi:hypothetical protein